MLVTDGKCDVEGRYKGRWQTAHYTAGSLGMTAPGEEVTLRWRGQNVHKTLQLHLPHSLIEDTLSELSRADPKQLRLPHRLLTADPLVEQVMRGLGGALAAGAPDLYAATAATFLTLHLLTHHGDCHTVTTPARDDRRLRRAEAYMRANLAAPLSLEMIAREAGISRFHFLRLFKLAHGETPLRCLTRMRIEDSKTRLRCTRETITQIAFACGYESSAHFASAFRRLTGVAPGAYRNATR